MGGEGFGCIFSAVGHQPEPPVVGSSIYSAQNFVLSRKFLNLLTKMGIEGGEWLLWRLFPLFCCGNFYIPLVRVADGAQERVGCTGMVI